MRRQETVSSFAVGAPDVRCSWRHGDAEGLRKAQVGAAWAVASHFTLSTEPALAVLPTGVGKTAVMTIVPYLVPTTRVLVITPSKLVRHQVAVEFEFLRTLRRARALAESCPAPRTKEVLGKVGSLPQWRALEEFEVVVATPQSVSAGNPGVAVVPPGMFDLVLVDEAHHAPAKTWQWLVDAFPETRRAFFTATPFRSDGKPILGKMVFSYPLARALADEVFAPVSFKRVASPTSYASRDSVLAAEAVARVLSPEHVAGRSLLLVRTNRKQHAKELVDTYRGLGFQIGIILADSSPKAVADVLRKLRDGPLQGLVTVGVVGEGFDEPRLKVAAYHRPHKSLPATLQFLGRLARISPDGGPAELLAYADDVAEETRLLYESDASWATLVPQLAEAAIALEAERNEYARAFRPCLPKAFSLHAVSAPREVRIFEVGPNVSVDLKFAAPSRLGNGNVIYHGVDSDAALTFTVTEHPLRPRWLLTDSLDSASYECHIVTVVKTAANSTLIFILSDSDQMHDRWLRTIGAPDAPRLRPEAVNQILHALNLLSASSIGLRAGSSGWGRRPEYKTLSGSKVNNAVHGGDAQGYGFGHIMALHQNGAQFETIGASTGKAKIWKPGNVPLLEYRRWCEFLAAKLQTPSTGSKVPLFDVHVPSQATRFPETPFAVSLLPGLLDADITIRRSDGSSCSLQVVTLTATRVSNEECIVRVEHDGDTLADYTVDLHGKFTTVADVLTDAAGTTSSTPLADLLTQSSTAILFSDGAVFSDGQILRPREGVADYPSSLLLSWGWDGIDIRSETDAAVGLISIHRGSEAKLIAEYPRAWVLCDDASSEIADFAVIDVDPADAMTVTIDLVHCKFSKTETPGRDVSNLYEVLGQAVRSGKWAGGAPQSVFKDLARRVRTRSATKILQGDKANLLLILDHWASHPPQTRYLVTVVQPGLDIDKAREAIEVRSLLSAANDWLTQMNASLRVVGSRLAS